MISLFTCDLRKLNSMTKYPSIDTYHKLGKGGVLTDEHNAEIPHNAIATEKVDGTNARIIILPNGQNHENTFVLGSREELLHAEGDLIINPVENIVETLLPKATEIINRTSEVSCPTVFFVEVYGGRIGRGWKQYTSDKNKCGFRLFDICQVHNYEELFTLPVEKIAAWRQQGGQQWENEQSLENYSIAYELPLTPRLDWPESWSLHGRPEMPVTHKGVLSWLQEIVPTNGVALDDGAKGKAEGVVVRTEDRSRIVKVRYEEYERTLRRKT